MENLEEHTTGKNNMEQALKTPQNQIVAITNKKEWEMVNGKWIEYTINFKSSEEEEIKKTWDK